MSNPNGQTITVCGNTFRLNETIGRGSYGTVHKATNLTTHAVVAVKVISKDRIRKKHERQSIEKEIETMRVAVEQYENGHPHIVRLLCTKESQNNIFIVLEYCAGGDIATHMKAKGGLSEDQAKVYMAHLAAGLQFLRSQNVVHRDLKPANLLLSHKNPAIAKLKIADFGFARELDNEALAQSVVGSPLYMAPELLEYKSYDAKADLWSVGIILYEMLVNDHPFLFVDKCHATNHMGLRRNIHRYYELNGRVCVPSHINVSVECANLIDGLLRLDPVDRISFENFFNASFLLPTRPTGVEQTLESSADALAQPLCDNNRTDSIDWVSISDEYVIVESEYEDIGREVLDERDLEHDFDPDVPPPACTLNPIQIIAQEEDDNLLQQQATKELRSFEQQTERASIAVAEPTKPTPTPTPLLSSPIAMEEKPKTSSVSKTVSDMLAFAGIRINSPTLSQSSPKAHGAMYHDENLEFEKTLGLSYQSFEVGNIALFVPTPHGDYIAFHELCPHYYLSTESLAAAKRGGQNPSYVLGHIVFIEDFVACAERNPYRLRNATPYHTVLVTLLSEAHTSFTPTNQAILSESEFEKELTDTATHRVSSATGSKHLPTNSSSHQRISFRNFQISDLVLFFLKSGKPQYLAFNQGCPHYYLAEESVAVAKGSSNSYPAYILGEVIFIDSLQATEDFNPHRLPYGTRFYVVTVATRMRPSSKEA